MMLLNQTNQKMKNQSIEVPNSGPLAIDEAREELKADIRANCIKPIDALEFFDDPNNENGYAEINIDQVVNLPSVLASKINAEAYLNESCLAKLCPMQIADLGMMAEPNADYIIVEQLKHSVKSNFYRFIETNSFCKDFNMSRHIIYHHILSDESTHILREYVSTLRGAFSVFKDNREDLDNLSAVLNGATQQIFIYIASQISFHIDTYLMWPVEHFRYSDYLRVVLEKYNESYESLRGLFDRDPEQAFGLFIKQNMAIELYGWFDNVLYPIVDTTIRSYSNLNSFVYRDYARMIMDDNARQIEQK